jgi:lysyl-tRNA synthetase class 2
MCGKKPIDTCDFGPAARWETLRRRAALLQRIRQFFADRDFLEVETPLLSPEVIPEGHIEPIPVALPGDHAEHQSARWLQASPEAHMKRLLAAGTGPIYQITRSFRAGEKGTLHNPEFAIVEWYHPADDMSVGMQLLDELCHALLDTPPAVALTYQEVFQQHVGLNPHTVSAGELAAACASRGLQLEPPPAVHDRDDWLNLLMACAIDTYLGQEAPQIVYDYPVTQAALAATHVDDGGREVAARFELFWQGVELANGYFELNDVVELRQRLNRVMEARTAAGKPRLPEPQRLYAAMKHFSEPCCGVALGFDRLVMLAAGVPSIQEVLAFPFDRA